VATKTPAATARAGAQTTINNQLKGAVATAMETAMTTTIKNNNQQSFESGGGNSGSKMATMLTINM
jgi:hypothetical protein